MNSEGCIVRGTLALVLKTCRIFGMAPLRFEKFRDGYKATVSYYYAIYSYIVVTFINTCPVVALSVDIQRRAIKARILSSLGLEIPDYVTVLICSGFGGYYGVQRMKKMIKYLNRLDKANMGINNKSDIKKIKKMKNRDNLILVVFVLYAAIFLAYTLAEVKISIKNFTTETFLITTYTLSSILFYNMILMELQVILVLLETHTVLKSINNKMDEMLSADIVENEYIKFLKCKNICSLSHAYVTVCNIISAMNRTEGGIILIIFTNFVITLITTLYYGLIQITDISIQYILQDLWCGLYVFRVMFFIETCHSISSEVTEMKMNLNLLMTKTTNVGKRIPFEIELMFKQFILNKPNYSPMEVFTPERSTIITMSSAVITYILFMIQLNYE